MLNDIRAFWRDAELISPINTEQKRAPAPFRLIPFRSERSEQFVRLDSFRDQRSVQLLTRRRRVDTPRTRHLALCTSQPTTHKPSKMKPNRL